MPIPSKVKVAETPLRRSIGNQSQIRKWKFFKWVGLKYLGNLNKSIEIDKVRAEKAWKVLIEGMNN